MTEKQKKYAKLRKALYGLAVAVGALLVVLGYVDTIKLGAYLAVVGALLGVAFYNVPSDDDVILKRDDSGRFQSPNGEGA